MYPPRIHEAIQLMDDFAHRTAVGHGRSGRRYLWTDAFAVMTDLGLYEVTGDERFVERAVQLVDDVHHVLGQHRSDDVREGWLSGLDGEEAERHPTRGGLRIGKPLPERPPGAAYDAHGEWDRDGQYFHYLTKWMHALDRVTRTTGDARFHTWAVELCRVAHGAFVVVDPADGVHGMAWKTSIGLDRSLVPSMGQHDPLDGHVTARQLKDTDGDGELDAIAADFRRLIDRGALVTTDPLGIGGLLLDAARLEQVGGGDDPLIEAVLDAARTGLRHVSRTFDPSEPASLRLAFRELGLAIGLSGLDALGPRAEALHRYVDSRETIIGFWRVDDSRRTSTWLEHEDIDAVMLACALVPRGATVLPPRPVD